MGDFIKTLGSMASTTSTTTIASSASPSSTSSSFLNRRKLGLTVNVDKTISSVSPSGTSGACGGVEQVQVGVNHIISAVPTDDTCRTNLDSFHPQQQTYTNTNPLTPIVYTSSPPSSSSSSPNSSYSSYSPVLSPVLLSSNNINNNVLLKQQQQQNILYPVNNNQSTVPTTTIANNTFANPNELNLSSSKLGLRINTDLIHQEHYVGGQSSMDSTSSSQSSSEEPLESSRWLGCDMDKFRVYDSVCSRVTDYLFMGSESIASDLSILQRHGITHIINASVQCPNYFESHQDHPFTYIKFPLNDHPSEDISAVFDQVISFIEMARSKNGKVFIHCQMGVSRSPCLCILWTMHSQRCSMETASDIIRTIRPISRPNVGFQIHLLNWAIKQGIQQSYLNDQQEPSLQSQPLLQPLQQQQQYNSSTTSDSTNM